MQKPSVRQPLPRLLVAGQDQFGHMTDSYQHVLHLRGTFAITYLGWDSALPHIDLDGVEITHFQRSGNKLVRYVAFLFRVLSEIRRGKYDLVYLSYFPGVGIFPVLAPGPRYVLDIRTGYVRRSELLRWFFNRWILLDSLMFRHITIISDSLRQFLHISRKKAHVLPLGATVPEVAPKRFGSMHLLYVGSLESRHIDRTVEGFGRFYRDAGGEGKSTYDIVGFGLPEDEEGLRAAIARSGCPEAITFHGRIPYTQLGPFFERGNIGIAFVPLVDYYHCQPPTKLFEYLLAGMAVLATATFENIKVMADHAGVVIDDSADAVYQGLMKMSRNLQRYDSRAIRASVEHYTWDRIVAENLRPYLLLILCGNGSAVVSR
jgi:glycosyltransferase involved in cell wall biosynthesis